MSRDKLLKDLDKLLEDEDAKTFVRGLTTQIAYLFWAGRTLRQSQEVFGKLRNGEELTGKEARRLVRLVGWLVYYGGSNWYQVSRDLVKYYQAADAITSRIKTQTEKLRTERKAAEDAEDGLNVVRQEFEDTIRAHSRARGNKDGDTGTEGEKG